VALYTLNCWSVDREQQADNTSVLKIFSPELPSSEMG